MKKININICNEEFKCRIPGLFACIDYSNGYDILRATTYENGSYGKYIENILLPSFASITGVLDGNTSYSYATLRAMYKKYFNVPEAINFINFFSRGIGLINVDRHEIASYTLDEDLKNEILDSNKTPLIPDKFYISTSKKMYNDLNDIKEMSKINNRDLILFKNSGGDCMLKYLYNKINEAEAIASEFYSYIDRDKSSYSINIQLNQTFKDLGIFEPIMEPWVGGVEYHKGNLVMFNYKTYRCIKDNSGTYDRETESYIFNANNEFIEVGDDKSIYSSSNTNGGVYDSNNIVIDSYGKSRLNELRRYKDYINYSEETEFPSQDEDWLFYYKKGYVNNLEVSKDDNNNILNFDLELTDAPVGEVVNNLLLYGNIMTNISHKIKNNKNYISFEYIIGAHLKAKLIKKEVADGKTFLYFDNFEYDPDDAHGIKFDEDYEYFDGDEIAQIITNGDFEVLVSHNEDIIIIHNGTYLILGENFTVLSGTVAPHNKYGNYDYIMLRDNSGIERYYKWYNNQYNEINNVVIHNYSTSKFPFKLNLETNIINISGNKIRSKYVKSHYITSFTPEVDSFYFPITKIDYLNGIPYSPIINEDVSINRGNAAAWERHIKLSEVKTMQDLENYGNDYFNIQKQ